MNKSKKSFSRKYGFIIKPLLAFMLTTLTSLIEPQPDYASKSGYIEFNHKETHFRMEFKTEMKTH